MTQQSSSEIPELTLGWRLKMALEHNHVSRSEMAEELGVDPATITRWTGDRGAPPKAGFLKQWALRCGVPYEWLVTGNTPPEVAQQLTVTYPQDESSPAAQRYETAVSSTAA